MYFSAETEDNEGDYYCQVKWFRDGLDMGEGVQDDGYGYLEFAELKQSDAGRWVNPIPLISNIDKGGNGQLVRKSAVHLIYGPNFDFKYFHQYEPLTYEYWLESRMKRNYLCPENINFSRFLS